MPREHNTYELRRLWKQRNSLRGWRVTTVVIDPGVEVFHDPMEDGQMDAFGHTHVVERDVEAISGDGLEFAAVSRVVPSMERSPGWLGGL